MRSIFRLISLFGFAAVLGSAPSSAWAVTLDQSASERFSFSFPNGDPNTVSYDGPGYNAFQPFSSFVSSQVFSLSAFNGLPKGSNLEFTFLSQAAAYDGTNSPAFTDRFGYKNGQGVFTTVFDSLPDGPGSQKTVSLGADELMTLALLSPEGLFTTVDSENHDKAAHILALKVDKGGNALINPTSVHGDPAFNIQLMPGDYLLFIEDLAITGNLNVFGIPDNGDFDYNDLVVLVRQSEVPEPATAALLGIGLAGALIRRRRQTTSH